MQCNKMGLQMDTFDGLKNSDAVVLSGPRPRAGEKAQKSNCSERATANTQSHRFKGGSKHRGGCV
jgi:hypothetical protein